MTVVPRVSKWFLIVICLMFPTHRAVAEFSMAEKQQFVDQIDTMNWLASASGELMGHLESHPRDAARVRKIVASLGGEKTGASFNLFEGLALLAGADDDVSTRRRVIQAAFQAIDSAYASFDQAENLLIGLEAGCSANCSHIGEALIYVRRARASYDAFDRTMPFEDPRSDANLAMASSSGTGTTEHAGFIKALRSTERRLLRAWNDSNRLAVANPKQAGNAAVAGMNYKLTLWRVSWTLGLLVGAEHPDIVADVDEVIASRGASNRYSAQLTVAEKLMNDIGLVQGSAGESRVSGLPYFYTAICRDKGRLLVESSFPAEVKAIGRELQHLCDAWGFSGVVARGGIETDPGVPAPSHSTSVPLAAPPPSSTDPQEPPVSEPPVSEPPVSEPPAPPYVPPEPGTAYRLLSEHLPPAGSFRLIPGSSIGDVLVQPNEFDFCKDISCFKAKNAFLAWVGMAFDETNGRWWNPAGGGHADYGGNEIYRFDFKALSWTRITDPEPLTGPFMVDTDQDGDFDGCPRPVSGPPAVHSYDGTIYVPSTDEVLVIGTVPFCLGAMANVEEGWVWSNATGRWRKLPNLVWSRYMRTAYDEARDRVYMVGGQGQGQFYELDPQRNYSVVREIQLGWSGTGVAEFDESTRYLYYSGSKMGIFRVHVSLDGTLGPRETVVKWTDSNPLPIAIHGQTGKLVTWAGDAQILRIDPTTGMTEDLTPASGPVPTRKNGVVYSKWIYIHAVDAFVGIDDAREGVWVYRLPDSGSVAPPSSSPLPPSPAPSPPPPPANPAPSASSFEERCNAAGVVFCDPLDSEGPWGVDASGKRRLMPNPDGTTGIPTTPWWRNWRGVQNSAAGEKPGHVLPRHDTTVKASGTGSLRFDYPSFSNSGGGGNFTTNFSDDLSQQFGEGDTFYVQHRWRANCDFIYLDCDPASPGYKTQRRSFRAPGGGTTAAKLAIIADGDPAIGESSDACTWLQVVTVHTTDHALKGFHSCGWYQGFDEPTGSRPFGSTQIDFQPNGDYDCWYLPDESSPEKHRWGYTGPNCWSLESDEWITVQVMIRVGRWQPDRNGEKTSHVTIWAAHEGEPQRVVVDHDVYLRGPQTPSGKYGKVWLLAFMTAKDDTEEHPTGNIWFDELIVSTRFIADPE